MNSFRCGDVVVLDAAWTDDSAVYGVVTEVNHANNTVKVDFAYQNTIECTVDALLKIPHHKVMRVLRHISNFGDKNAVIQRALETYAAVWQAAEADNA